MRHRAGLMSKESFDCSDGPPLRWSRCPALWGSTIHVQPAIACVALILVIVLLFARSVSALDHDWKTTGTGHVAAFPNAGQGAGDDVIAFLQVKPDVALVFDDSWRAVLAPRFRLGLTDSEYNFISLDDVYAEYLADRFEVRAGFGTFFWGAVESVNIVDVANQRDYRVDFFDPDHNKIGQPIVRLRGVLGEHLLDLYYFPYFMPANLPNKVNPYNPFGGRLDFSDDPFYTSGAERLRQEFALRWSRTIRSADVGLAYFNGYQRFPVPNVVPGKPEADALYYESQQISGDVQMSLGEWLLKGEALYFDTGIAGSFVTDSILPNGSVVRRDIVPDNLFAFVAGGEYTFYGVVGKSDVGLLAEYLYNTQQDLQAPGFFPFQNDLFLGMRWSRNNFGQGELLGGVILDLSNGSHLWRVEYTERFYDRVKLLAYLEIIDAAKGDPLAPFNSADNMAIELSYVY